jgi:hypothetical protein
LNAPAGDGEGGDCPARAVEELKRSYDNGAFADDRTETIPRCR